MTNLQTKILEIFKEFVRVCEKHNLTYYLITGSALGAVRHKGFIPWDDDLDVAMPRPDFEKLLSLQREFNLPFALEHFTTTPGFTLPYAKLVNKQTTFVEWLWQFHKVSHGVWMDIFILDGMSRSEKRPAKWKYHYLWFLDYFVYGGHLFAKPQKHNFFLQIPLYLIGLLFLPFNIGNWLMRRIDKKMKKIPYVEAFLVGSYFVWGSSREALPKAIYGEGVIVPFEDMQVRIPKDYHTYLTYRFNDYMAPPPLKHQVGKHRAIMLDLERSYPEYLARKKRP